MIHLHQRFTLHRLAGAADPFRSPYNGGGKGGSKMPDPNPGLFRAADVSERLGMAYLEEEKKQNAIQNERAEVMDSLTEQVVNQQLGIADRNQELAEEDIAYNWGTFRPVEQQLVDEAARFGTTAEQNRLAQQAETDVVSAYDRRRASTMDKLRQLGVNPASGNYAAMMADMDMEQAAAQAGAANRARAQGRDLAFAKKLDVANMGRGLASQASTSYGIALNAGNSAAGNQAQANASYNQGVGVSQSYGRMGIGAMQGSANIYQNAYNSQLNAWGMQQQANAQNSAGLWGAAGTLGGAAFAAF
jgi:hypothetical protein